MTETKQTALHAPTPLTERQKRIANLAALGVARTTALTKFNTIAQEVRDRSAKEPPLTPEQSNAMLMELELARADMIHCMADYTAAVNTLNPGAPGLGSTIAGVPGA